MDDILTEQICVRLTEPEKAWLASKITPDRRSASAVVRSLIARGMKAEGK